MEFKQIQELIKLVGKSEIGEIRIKDGEFEITLRSNDYISNKGGGRISAPMYMSGPAPAQAPSASHQAPQSLAGETSKSEAPAAQTAALAKDNGHLVMKSPMIGTFYRSPSPDKDAFVKVGDVVQKGDVLCIIEAMKLFNEIESEFSGKIIKVLAEDSSPVEYDQPLFEIDPSAA